MSSFLEKIKTQIKISAGERVRCVAAVLGTFGEQGSSDAVGDDAAAVAQDKKAQRAALDDMAPLFKAIVAISLDEFLHSHKHLQSQSESR